MLVHLPRRSCGGVAGLRKWPGLLLPSALGRSTADKSDNRG